MASPGDTRSAALESLERCEKLSRFLLANRITFEEYAFNVMESMIHIPEDEIQHCVATVPANTVARYAEYLRVTLEPVDFMPSPISFLVSPCSEEKIERKKRQLWPKYLLLYELMKKKAGSSENAVSPHTPTGRD